jgi:hypothetical protein
MGTRTTTLRTGSWLSVVGAMALGLAAAARGDTPGTQPPLVKKPVAAEYQIKSLRAYLYYQERGRFDDQDILTGKVALWNVLIGGGDSLAASGATLIHVDIEGPDFAKSVPPAALLIVDARSGGRQVGAARVRLKEFFSESGRVAIPVIVHGSLCKDLRITARLEGVKNGRVTTATAPFACGE